mmetsp:Transcript_7464/g.8614  ORF Transcript_7464/g.8614 Transcript_7464/m.8614 type:complete len:570 (-) Transcript_7464:147-1856(-)|eukprot:CAMPEP_0197856410 /NCGR_PEP_ID=MMETSP1438-20131217/28529_1 /TAXON_ID=1461541 /ORGANISM="Pterosperma sp., Strain CCMP1384" /LENGTH=569 /DNA_ID=CAMNT_0043471857 /DNA_START=93 /DNA_END=1802 /DNA_ORIENTATION=+
MALAAERAKYGLPPEFKVTREMKKSFTPQEKVMYKTAHEIGGVQKANDVMRAYFAQKAKRAAAEAAAKEGGGASGGGQSESAAKSSQPASGTRSSDPAPAAPVAAPKVEEEEELTAELGENNASGQLLEAGTLDWDNVGKKSTPLFEPLYSFNRVMAGVRIRLVASGPAACHSVAVDEAGQCYTWGRNDAGQLGHGDTTAYNGPTLVHGMKGKSIRDASCGRKHTVVCTTEGTVFAWGSHKCGQLGTGGAAKEGFTVPVQAASWGGGSPVVRVACGAEFSMAVNEDGKLAAWGHPMDGQLGNGGNGEYIERAGSISYQWETAPLEVKFGGANIIDVACGNAHTCAVSSTGKVYTWGNGGYGRLGHNNQKEVMVPLEVAFFSGGFGKGPNQGVTKAVCGATCTYAIQKCGKVFFWGRTKSTGEAVMYPKPIPDLSGWNVSAIACGNTSTVVSADNSVITWGPSPTYGELGYGHPDNGAPKSSTQPKLVDDLPNVKVLHAAVGFGHSLLVADIDDSATNETVEKLETYEPEPQVPPTVSTKGKPAKLPKAPAAKKRPASGEAGGGAKKGKK